jgi:hypothetical protein
MSFIITTLLVFIGFLLVGLLLNAILPKRAFLITAFLIAFAAFFYATYQLIRCFVLNKCFSGLISLALIPVVASFIIIAYLISITFFVLMIIRLRKRR